MLSRFSLCTLSLRRSFLTLALCLIAATAGQALAQTQQQSADEVTASKFFKASVRAGDAGTLVAGQSRIKLWGVRSIEYMPATFQLRARTALDNAIGSAQVECEVKARIKGEAYAQCVNSNDVDLSLYMVQRGFVSVDRSSVYGTVFEDPYIEAETEAQNNGTGIWAAPEAQSGSSEPTSGNLMLSFGFILFMIIIAAFTSLTIIIMSGFQKVVDAQKENLDFMTRERALRDKERGIVATILDSELKANKAKIEAYLVVYEEMLKALKNPDRVPKYKQAGDIVQQQPALSRAVFDRNADKLDTLGQRLAGHLVNFYAQIKNKPEYGTLEPEMSIEQATRMVEDAVENARRLNDLAGTLINEFSSSGLSRDAAEEA